MMNVLRRYPLAAFFVLAYLISWGLSLFAARGLLPFPVPPPLAGLASLLYHFGPALAGIILAALEAGRSGVRNLLRPLFRLRVGVGWYLFIILYPLGLRLVTSGLGYVLGGPPPAFFTAAGIPSGNPLLLAIPIFLSTLVLAGLAEEIGWRGYALPRLQSRAGALAASLVLAALWAPWHYNPLNFPAIRPVLPWHVLSVFAMTILLAWVYNGTGGSLGMCVLFHAFSNFSDWVVSTSAIVGQGDIRANIIQALLNLGVAVVMVIVFGRENLSRNPRVREG